MGLIHRPDLIWIKVFGIGLGKGPLLHGLQGHPAPPDRPWRVRCPNGLTPSPAPAEGVEQQQALVGVQGPEAQRAAIAALEQGPAFQALQQQGENALLQQASATGGLRGGNVQAALAQFRPQLLSQLIEQQYGQLGGLVKYGQASAAGTGAAAQETGSNVAQLLAAQGAAQAGGQLAAGKAFASIPSAISGGLGIFSGLGGKF